MEGTWNRMCLDALIRIQNGIEDVTWTKLMTNMTKEDKSIQHQTGINLEDLARDNWSVLISLNPKIFIEVKTIAEKQKHHVHITSLETFSEVYGDNNIQWWPDNFLTFEKFLEFLEIEIKSIQ